MPDHPFTLQPRLTQIAMTVRPKGLIADMVSPRVMVGAERFAYTKMDEAQHYTIPDTLIGRKGAPAEVEFTAADTVASTKPYGLQDVVPIRDITAARDSRANVDPLAVATMGITQLCRLAREKRVADQIFTSGSYSAALRTTLAGNSQWSDEDSDPIGAITDAKDAMLVMPNTLVLGQATWSALRRHPQIVEATRMTGAGRDKAAGLARLEAVADELEIDHVVVGMGWHNTAKPGQDASYGRLWGKHASLLRVDGAIASPMTTQPTFAFTAEWQGEQAGTYLDPKPGGMGAEVVKVWEDILEVLSWQDAGYFFQNAVA